MTKITLTQRKRTSLLVVHCSATRRDQDIGAQQITQWHLQKGWSTIGYHYVIRRNGSLENGREETSVGAHVAGHNEESIGICLVGGIDLLGKPENNFTAGQFETLHRLLGELRGRYPATRIVGHRDLSPNRNGDKPVTPDQWLKACPSFDVGAWLMLNPPR